MPVQEGAEDGFEASGVWLGEAGVDWCCGERIELCSGGFS